MRDPGSAIGSPDLDLAGTDAGPDASARWEPLALRRAELDALVDRLLDADRDGPDLRRALLVHPRGRSLGRGLAPSIQVAVEVLRPGEEAMPPRRSSAALVLQLRGEAVATVNGDRRAIGVRDVRVVPPRAIHRVQAGIDLPLVQLSFSNAALLELLGVHHVEALAELEGGSLRMLGEARPLPGAAPDDVGVRHDGRVHPLADAWRLEYERLIDPPWVPLRPWHWAWRDIEAELDRMGTLDERYRGRRVCLLHDPATGRTNGTTPTLFASMCVRPAGVVDRPHRHSAAAVNYFLGGSGWSEVDDQRIEWEAGDLVFIAPGWAVHHHASGDAPVHQLAVQDNPLHLAMGSLVWQEDLDGPVRLLGAEPGFTTNRHLIEVPAAAPPP